jgi:K+-sensing histidine kinase KdpD
MHHTAHTLPSKAPDQRAQPVLSGRVRPILLRCGLALLLVAAAVAISYPLRGQIYATPLFFVAVVLSCWYGGTVPGVLAAIASTAVIHFLILSRAGNSRPTLTTYRG